MKIEFRGLFFAVLLCFGTLTTASALEVTDTLILTSDEMVGNPFGLTEMPSTFHAYFSYDDSALDSGGIYRNQLRGFNFAIGDSRWALNDITDNVFTSENGKIVTFLLDFSPLPSDNNKQLSISDSDFIWSAVDAYDRPTPSLSGTYTIVQGEIPAPSAVPVPCAIILFASGIVGLVGTRFRRIKK